MKYLLKVLEVHPKALKLIVKLVGQIAHHKKNINFLNKNPNYGFQLWEQVSSEFSVLSSENA